MKKRKTLSKSMIIRTAKLQEYPSIKTLYDQLLSFHMPRRFPIWFEKEEEIKKKIKQRKIIVARENDKILGHLCFEKYPDSIEIDTLIVDKEYKKLGVGKSLVNYFINEKASRLSPKIKNITVGTYKCFKEKNLYLKMGFKEVLPEEFEKYYPRDWWEFTKKIE